MSPNTNTQRRERIWHAVASRSRTKERNMSNQPVAVVTGVGPGLGAALARRFAATYAVAILARKADYLKALAGEIRQTRATVLDLSCDVSDPAQITEAFRAIRKELGEPDVLLYNAGSGTFGSIMEITAEQYEADWRVNRLLAFVAAPTNAPAPILSWRWGISVSRASSRGGEGPQEGSVGHSASL